MRARARTHIYVHINILIYGCRASFTLRRTPKGRLREVGRGDGRSKKHVNSRDGCRAATRLLSRRNIYRAALGICMQTRSRPIFPPPARTQRSPPPPVVLTLSFSFCLAFSLSSLLGSELLPGYPRSSYFYLVAPSLLRTTSFLLSDVDIARVKERKNETPQAVRRRGSFVEPVTLSTRSILEILFSHLYNTNI